MAGVIAGVTTPSERLELEVTPAGFPLPKTDVPGCVHQTTTVKLTAVRNAFAFAQWAYECERNNRYAGSLIEVSGSQGKMKMATNKIGPFRP